MNHKKCERLYYHVFIFSLYLCLALEMVSDSLENRFYYIDVEVLVNFWFLPREFENSRCRRKESGRFWYVPTTPMYLPQG